VQKSSFFRYLIALEHAAMRVISVQTRMSLNYLFQLFFNACIHACGRQHLSSFFKMISDIIILSFALEESEKSSLYQIRRSLTQKKIAKSGRNAKKNILHNFVLHRFLFLIEKVIAWYSLPTKYFSNFSCLPGKYQSPFQSAKLSAPEI
jgi:hypothetical protein